MQYVHPPFCEYSRGRMTSTVVLSVSRILSSSSIPFAFDTPSSSNNPRSSVFPKSKSSSRYSNASFALFLFLFVPVDNGSLAFLLALDDESFALLVLFDKEKERGA